MEEKQVEVKTLHVKAHVRYWEDAEINGVEDTDGTLTPCKEGELWCPIIDLDTGIILNWEQGKEAKIHFKVCDSGSYFIKNEKGYDVLLIEDDYVPSIMSPGGDGYGDYIIMNIDKYGRIENWKPDLSDFENRDE